MMCPLLFFLRTSYFSKKYKFINISFALIDMNILFLKI